MRKLQLVKGHSVEDQPRPRQAAEADELRFRYPAEEVWEVSEGWERPESSSRRTKTVGAN